MDVQTDLGSEVMAQSVFRPWESTLPDLFILLCIFFEVIDFQPIGKKTKKLLKQQIKCMI
jgi:hypothetical protein